MFQNKISVFLCFVGFLILFIHNILSSKNSINENGNCYWLTNSLFPLIIILCQSSWTGKYIQNIIVFILFLTGARIPIKERRPFLFLLDLCEILVPTWKITFVVNYKGFISILTYLISDLQPEQGTKALHEFVIFV